MRDRELFRFAQERHRIYERRERGEQKPWTRDKILQRFRFTNMYRELDVVTKWIAENWRDPYANERHLWFAMTVARFLNVPEALQEMGFPMPWGSRRDRVLRILKARKQRGEIVFSGAYMVRSDPCPKIDYVGSVLDRLWKDRERIAEVIYRVPCYLQDLHETLVPYYGMGTFMSGQVIADLKYVKPLSGAEDWWTFAGSGPGSRRGLNRVLNRPIATPWREADWHDQLMLLHDHIRLHCKKQGMPLPHAQDLQGWLCEFDKYERTRLGEGRPRSLYPGI